MTQQRKSPEDILLETARLGIEAEAFLASSLGRYLVESAELKIEENTKKLVAASPNDIDANTQFRNEINVGQLFISWINQAVSSGQNAHSELDGNDTADY